MAFLICASFVRADVPAVVQKEFEKKFPGALKPKWDQQKDCRCDVKFKWNDKKCLASFRESGEWLHTETMLSYKELPLNLKKAINIKYTVGSIKEASKIEKSEGISYRIYLKPGWSPDWIQFAEDGTEM